MISAEHKQGENSTEVNKKWLKNGKEVLVLVEFNFS